MLHLTALSRAEFGIGFAIARSLGQEGTLQSRAAGELHVGVRHEVAQVFVATEYREATHCSANGILPRHASLATVGLYVIDGRRPQFLNN